MFRLKWWFAIISFLGFIAVGIFLQRYYLTTLTNQLIELGQDVSLTQIQSLARSSSLQYVWLQEDTLQNGIDPLKSEHLLILDHIVHDQIAGSNIRKIHMYNSDGRVVYSTDFDMIGLDKSDNSALVMAQNGEPYSFLTFQDSYSANGEQYSDRYILSTLFLIGEHAHNSEAFVEAVEENRLDDIDVPEENPDRIIEIETDFTDSVQQLDETHDVLRPVIGGILASLLIALLAFVFYGSRTIETQYNTLTAAQEQLHMERETLAERINKRTLELAGAIRFAEEARQEAEQANNAKTTFLATMSHELRTPLNAIIGYTELLQETAEDESDDIYLEDLIKVEKSARLLLGIVQDILDVSRIESGQIVVETSPFHLVELVEDVIFQVSPTADRNQTQIIKTVKTDPGLVFTDQQKVQQILLNILGNSAKFTLNGQIEIIIDQITRFDKPFIQFTVADTGIGMSTEYLEHIFEPFRQADSNISRHYGGSGLGMTIVKRLCEILGGDVTVKSEMGEGTVVVITLPCKLEENRQQTSDNKNLKSVV